MTQYETLRAAALGNALPPEARAGLMLFLHTGLWGWTRAVTAMRALRAAGQRQTIELEGAGGTQKPSSTSLLAMAIPNRCFRSNPHE